MFRFIQRLLGFGQSEKKNGRSRKKAGNRRVRRIANPERMPLDFDPQTPKIRKQKKEERRRQGLRTTAIMATGISLVALGNTAVQETLIRNPRFALRHVGVDTIGMLSPTRIINATGLTDGVNLLTVNLRDVRERVQRLPGVRSATVQRDFDGRLTITVDQRKPVAWVKSDFMHWVPRSPAHGMLVDADSVLIPAEAISEEMLALPEICVDTIRQGDAGTEVTDAKFRIAMKLTKDLLKRQEQGGAQVKSVEALKKFALVAKFKDGATTTFSIDEVESQLQRYDAVVAQSRGGKFEIDKINLIGERVAPVAFKFSADPSQSQHAEPPAPQPPPASSSKSSKSSAKSKSGNRSH